MAWITKSWGGVTPSFLLSFGHSFHQIPKLQNTQVIYLKNMGHVQGFISMPLELVTEVDNIKENLPDFGTN